MDKVDLAQEFRDLVKRIQRPGVDKLMEMVEKSDFFTAPASTRFHGSYEGGLVEHSLQVYKRLSDKKNNDPFWRGRFENLNEENIMVAGLLHDLCKIYFYEIEMRNKKIDGKWESVPFYTVNDKIPYGHGEKSVMMIEEYLKLKPVERYAIRWHMGPYSGSQDWQTYGQAIEKYPLALALFEADMEATHITEVE